MTTRNVKFVTFTVDEFTTALKSAVRATVDAQKYTDVSIREDKESPEHAFKVYVGVGAVYIHITSSIHRGNARSDGYGEDPIHINLIDGHSNVAALPKQSHVKRISTWATNLANRIDNMFLQAYTLEFCPCGSPKREFTKRDRSGTFVACCGWKTERHKKHFGKN